MTPDELDRRVKDIAEETDRIFAKQTTYFPRITETAARLALEGWEKPDPLLLEAREMCAKVCEGGHYPNDAKYYRGGNADNTLTLIRTLAALKRGYALGKEAAR